VLGSLRSLADSENGPLMVLGEAEESHPSDSVAASAGDLLTTICWGSLRSPAENGPLMAPADWGRAKEADEVKESWPMVSIPVAIATLLVTLGSAAHSSLTLVMIPGYPVRVGGRPCTCDVPPPPTALSATTDQLMTMCRGSLRSPADSENGPLTVLGEAEEAEESCPSGSVAASAGDLLTTMCRSSPTSLAYSENGPLMVLGEAEESRPSGSVAASAGDLLTTVCQGSSTSLADSKNDRPSGQCATLLAILGSMTHSSASSKLLTRMTRGFPVSVGCNCQSAVPLPPPIIGPRLTKSASRVWAGGPLRS
jgi:hypothetical protein